jgi:hypothetical protein
LTSFISDLSIHLSEYCPDNNRFNGLKGFDLLFGLPHGNSHALCNHLFFIQIPRNQSVRRKPVFCFSKYFAHPICVLHNSLRWIIAPVKERDLTDFLQKLPPLTM